MLELPTPVLLAAARSGDFVALFPCCFMACFGLFIIATIAFQIWTIIEVATKEPGGDDQNKLIWILIVVLAGVIGSIIYWLVRRPERIRRYGR